MFRCRLFGHDHRFVASGSSMTWSCARGCGAGGAKEYPTAADAARYAAALDRRPTGAGGPLPPLSLLPLRIARALRRRRG